VKILPTGPVSRKGRCNVASVGTYHAVTHGTGCSTAIGVCRNAAGNSSTMKGPEGLACEVFRRRRYTGKSLREWIPGSCTFVPGNQLPQWQLETAIRLAADTYFRKAAGNTAYRRDLKIDV
jgi:hypothetical protein